MFRRLTALATVLAFVAAPFPFIRTANAGARNHIPDQYIVVFKDNVRDPGAQARGLAARHGLALRHTYAHAIKGFAAKVPPARLAALRADPTVSYIEQDEVVTIAAQTRPTGIRRIGADVSPTARIDGSDQRVNVDVAVLDTGIDTRHGDLYVVGGKNCTSASSYRDDHGHGTHVAGTIGAKDNKNGVVGVAPGARLWAVKVLESSGGGSVSGLICGIDWVTANAATIEVANMSLGLTGNEPNYADGTTWEQNCPYPNGWSLHNAMCRSVMAGVP